MHNNFYKTFIFFIIFLDLFSTGAIAQQRKYTVSNAHAHNDYLHPVPFYTAYNAGFGSIEADIFLVGNNLLVAHNIKDIDATRTLQALYLDPLRDAIQKNKGLVYPDRLKVLILLIDIKTMADPTLQVVLNVLQQYKIVTDCPGLKIVITGNQPDISRLTSYPSYIYFDGDLNKSYKAEELNRVALFSANFQNYSSWNGEGIPIPSEREKLDSAVMRAHVSNKPIRFWAAPDFLNAWIQLMHLNVDYINTDKIAEISIFLNKFSSNPNFKRRSKYKGSYK